MELIDITPEDSVVKIYLKELTIEEQEDLDSIELEASYREQEVVNKEAARQRGIEILQSLGLDEEAAKAIAGI